MKKIIALICLAFAFYNAKAQSVEITQSDLTFTRSDKPVYKPIHIYIKNNQPGQQVDITITENNSGTAHRNVDYVIKPYEKLTIDSAIVNILVNPDSAQKTDETITLNVIAVYNNVNIYNANTTVTIKPSQKPKDTGGKKYYGIDSARFTILTAGSLNFYGKQQFSKFVGELDVRLPTIAGRFGLNTGVFTKNYYTDSLFRGTGTFNIRTNDSTKYNQKTINRYASLVYDVYGAYVNPTILLFKSESLSGHFRLYLDFNFEILSTTINTSYRYKTIDSTTHAYNQKVTIDSVYAANDPRIVQPNFSESFLTGFYGLGPQIMYEQDNLINLNILFVGGRSFTSYNKNNEIPLYAVPGYNTKQWYYLVKGVITEKVTKLNATIGVEVRGLYPNSIPSIAAYLGFLISPSDFFKKSQ